MFRPTLPLLFALLVATTLTVTTAKAQPFVYQGSLTSGAVPVNTPHDFTFRIYTAATGGSQVGTTSTASDITPENGTFTATVSPGNNVFTGPDRWLEIAVRSTGSPTYTTLSPRQKITPSPYAIRSLSERWTDLGNTFLTNTSAVSSVFLNRTTPVTGADFFTVRTPTTQQQFGGMYIDTAAGDGLPFYGYATGGTVRGYSYIDGTSGTWNLNLGGDRVSVSNLGNVGIATQPVSTERVQVNGNVRVTSTVTAADFAYTTPKTRVLMLSAEDFHATRATDIGQFGFGSDPRAALDPSIGYGEIVAPLHLPQGALITDVQCYMAGPSTSNQLRLEIQFRPVTSLSSTPIVEATTATTSFPIPATINPLNSPIDNTTRSYCVRVIASDWTASHFVRNVRIAYTIPNPE